MKQIIKINDKRIKLDASQLIQSGGEGMVFGLGDMAVKLYHQPTGQHRTKLQHLLRQQWPNGVLGPVTAVSDTKNQIIGFQMPKLTAGSQPFKKLSNPMYRKKNSIKTESILSLLTSVHQTVTTLHQNKIIIGDLNDTNIFFTPPPIRPLTCYFLDVDSYQLAHFPCPVAMESFLDPTLFHVENFSNRPVFTPLTDWYAFAILLTKSLLQVHPYGGSHHHHKSIRSRAEAKVSVWNTAVTYPKRAFPPETLPDEMLQTLHLIFDKGERRPFPLATITDYANNLTECPHCHLTYAAQRSGCPACHHQTPAPSKVATDTIRTLLQVDGFIEHVALRQDGRFWVITRNDNQFNLILAGIGGKVSEMSLFSGSPGYQFGIFKDYLVVNPPQRRQLLILDVRGRRPRQVTMIETALFRETAVFATTPTHLYRIAGTWVMQGSIQDGHFVEDPIATAHRKQTKFWASAYDNTIAGYHRIFAEHRFFMHNNQGHEIDLAVPLLPANEYITETAVSCAPDHVAFLLKVGSQKQYRTEIHKYSFQGQWLSKEVHSDDAWETAVITYPFHKNPSELNKHYHLSSGVLITTPEAVKYAK
jgi:serine/threonine protein kinase